jgi:hypothetical protein
MANAHQVRVPHILQNDRQAGVPIRCGPASIQAILYGLDNTRFDPPTSGALKGTIPVQHDQEAIWTVVKSHSAEVAAELGGEAGISEEHQVCAGEPRECFITHPKAMEIVLRQGIQTEGLQLAGRPDVRARLIQEDEVAAAVVDSLSQGVATAILIDRSHWVVAFATSPLANGDFQIEYRDPAVPSDTKWEGIEGLLAATVDISPAAGQQTFVVGVQTAGLDALRTRLRGARAIAPRRIPDLAGEFAGIFGDRARSLADPDSQLQKQKATRVLRVRPLRRSKRAYRILEFLPDMIVIVDAENATPLISASRSERHGLPEIISRDEIKERLAQRSGDGARLTLADQISIDEDLVWDYCDQSRSMFIPFYVVRNPGGAPDPIFVRANDGMPFAALTHRL